MIGEAQRELAPSKRQETGPEIKAWISIYAPSVHRSNHVCFITSHICKGSTSNLVRLLVPMIGRCLAYFMIILCIHSEINHEILSCLLCDTNVNDSFTVADGRTCTCPAGYAGSGVGPSGCVVTTGACANNPCGNNGVCQVSEMDILYAKG